jgi:hypothetical protein
LCPAGQDASIVQSGKYAGDANTKSIVAISPDGKVCGFESILVFLFSYSNLSKIFSVGIGST